MFTKFWNNVNKTSNCWLWTGYINEKGYGRLRYGGKLVYAHRLSYLLHNQQLPSDLCVLHKCDNPPCVNPDHLFLGTKKQNNEDMASKGRQFFQRCPEETQGEKHRNSRLTNSDVLEIRRMSLEGVKNVRLSEKFGVTKTMIGYIVSRKNWIHI